MQMVALHRARTEACEYKCCSQKNIYSLDCIALRKRLTNTERISTSQIKAVCESCCKSQITRSGLFGVSHIFRTEDADREEGLQSFSSRLFCRALLVKASKDCGEAQRIRAPQ